MKLFWNTKLLWNAKKLSCNTKRRLWNTKTVDEIERGYSGKTKSFHVILRRALWTTEELLWNGSTEHHEALWNTKKIYEIPRSCPEIPRSSLEYQEALTNISCKSVSGFRPYKVREKKLRGDAKPGQGQAQMP